MLYGIKAVSLYRNIYESNFHFSFKAEQTHRNKLLLSLILIISLILEVLRYGKAKSKSGSFSCLLSV